MASQSIVINHLFDFIKTEYSCQVEPNLVEEICKAAVELFASLKKKDSTIGGIVSIKTLLVQTKTCCELNPLYLLRKIYTTKWRERESFIKNCAMPNANWKKMISQERKSKKWVEATWQFVIKSMIWWKSCRIDWICSKLYTPTWHYKNQENVRRNHWCASNYDAEFEYVQAIIRFAYAVTRSGKLRVLSENRTGYLLISFYKII